MSFLEDLANNNNTEKETEKKGKSPRELWESCFKYFQHFTSIIQKENKTFDSEFNFVFLNIKKECLITGPYEIKRTQSDGDLVLEIKMFNQLKHGIKINRKDKRSAELLNIKLSKDHILSSIKQDNDGKFFLELNPKIVSFFRIKLNKNQKFHIEYTNICSSTKRSIPLPVENIDEAHMEELAKYILGQKPSLYTESISDQKITKIRDKIELQKRLQAKKDENIQKDLIKQEQKEVTRLANTFKEKSKRYLSSQSLKLKNKILDKIKSLKTD